MNNKGINKIISDSSKSSTEQCGPAPGKVVRDDLCREVAFQRRLRDEKKLRQGESWRKSIPSR